MQHPYIIATAIFSFAGTTSAMRGMGFNSLDNWPSSGLTNVRVWDIGVTWKDIHLGVDVYDWSRLDAVIDQIQSVGAQATYVIGATPRWLAKYP